MYEHLYVLIQNHMTWKEEERWPIDIGRKYIKVRLLQYIHTYIHTPLVKVYKIHTYIHTYIIHYLCI